MSRNSVRRGCPMWLKSYAPAGYEDTRKIQKSYPASIERAPQARDICCRDESQYEEERYETKSVFGYGPGAACRCLRGEALISYECNGCSGREKCVYAGCG